MEECLEKIKDIPRFCKHKNESITFGIYIPTLNLKLGYRGCKECEIRWHNSIFDIVDEHLNGKSDKNVFVNSQDIHKNYSWTLSTGYHGKDFL